MSEADARLMGLLDEALAPEAPRADLAERVFLASRAGLRRRSVLGRIGMRHGFAAAAVLLAVGAGMWSAGQRPAVRPSELAGAAPMPGEVVQIRAGEHLQAAFDELGSAPIDRQIELLALQIELAQSDLLWPRSNQDPLIEAAQESQFDRLNSEVQWVF